MSYIGKLFKTGAIRETPKSVIKAIVDEVDGTAKINIVEFGAGKGEITMALLGEKDISIECIYAFELDESLGKDLQSLSPKLEVHYEDAFEFDKWIPADAAVGYFICAIPLSFYSSKKIKPFLLAMNERLEPGGKIVIIFNAFWLGRLFRKVFSAGVLRIFATFPVYFLWKRVK